MALKFQLLSIWPMLQLHKLWPSQITSIHLEAYLLDNIYSRLGICANIHRGPNFRLTLTICGEIPLLTFHKSTIWGIFKSGTTLES